MCSRTARSPSATPSPRFSALSRNAFVLGGTGHVGRAIALSLLGDGWAVMLASRESPAPPGLEDVPVVHLDRDQEGALTPANGFDLVVDVVPFELAHADQLLELDVGGVVAISSASVYPVEQRLLENGRVPATIVRPCAIYGPGDRLAREWFFVKRALDRRPYILLTMRGANLFHTTASANIGELVRMIAARRGTGVFNCGDPDPPTVLDISRRIARAVGHEWTEVLLPRAARRGAIGNTPWSAPKPFL